MSFMKKYILSLLLLIVLTVHAQPGSLITSINNESRLAVFNSAQKAWLTPGTQIQWISPTELSLKRGSFSFITQKANLNVRITSIQINHIRVLISNDETEMMISMDDKFTIMIAVHKGSVTVGNTVIRADQSVIITETDDIRLGPIASLPFQYSSLINELAVQDVIANLSPTAAGETENTSNFERISSHMSPSVLIPSGSGGCVGSFC